MVQVCFVCLCEKIRTLCLARRNSLQSSLIELHTVTQEFLVENEHCKMDEKKWRRPAKKNFLFQVCKCDVTTRLSLTHYMHSTYSWDEMWSVCAFVRKKSSFLFLSSLFYAKAFIPLRCILLLCGQCAFGHHSSRNIFRSVDLPCSRSSLCRFNKLNDSRVSCGKKNQLSIVTLQSASWNCSLTMSFVLETRLAIVSVIVVARFPQLSLSRSLPSSFSFFNCLLFFLESIEAMYTCNQRGNFKVC